MSFLNASLDRHANDDAHHDRGSYPSPIPSCWRVDRTLPAGEYEVVTDEELVEGLSFPVYRPVSTMIYVPTQSLSASSVEMVTIDPLALQEARDRDARVAKPC